MNSFSPDSMVFRRSSNKIMLPRLILAQNQLPINLQRASSLSSIVLPKISVRSDTGQEVSHFLSPKSEKQPIISAASSPIYLAPSFLPLSSSVISTKTHGVVQLYCANTHKGIVRSYNEDRVMIMLRIPKPNDRKEEKWPLCSFFGLYDGHGGKTCPNFLRDNLHLYITQDSNFPNDPQKAIFKGFERAEADFTDLALRKKDKSGSCAVVLLIVGKKCFIANLGDSRALMSLNNGSDCIALTKDHKPSEESETRRIVEAGGEVYSSGKCIGQTVARILPGKLSVSRAFGDIEAKVKALGGNPNALIAVPEIKACHINKNIDFIVLACDGVFDRLENREVVNIINNQNGDPVDRLTKGVEGVIKESMIRESYDNITVLAVAFENYSFFKGKN